MSSEQKAFFHSFDAAVWAKAFIERAKSDPSIAIDEGTMIAWFANALMRGYDEYRWRQEKTEPTENSLQLAAQAWCEPSTSGIEMDSRLATAFARIIDKDRAPLLARIAELEGKLIDFDTWKSHPYTKVLEDSIENDYVPKYSASAPPAPGSDGEG